MLTETDGEFRELPSGRVVEPVQWLLQKERDFTLAGVVGYEFAWELDRVDTDRPECKTPRIFVGAFESQPIEASLFPLGIERAGQLTTSKLPNREEYESAVTECVEAIFDGEIFEVNHTDRFEYRWSGSPIGLLEKMAEVSAGEYIGHARGEVGGQTFAVVSMSPETFLKIENGRVETRPIKGTRAASTDGDLDRQIIAELKRSEKDRAENVMIVDLMRNDLSRVCEPGSVIVSSLCHVESFVSLHHLVSVVEGTLADTISPMRAFLSCFPAGSITGAPKLRAIEIACRTERSARGFYTGSFFVCTPDGRLDSSVAIRTATMFEERGGWSVVYGAGGAVVSDSDPSGEFEEALVKAKTIHAIAESQ